MYMLIDTCNIYAYIHVHTHTCTYTHIFTHTLLLTIRTAHLNVFPLPQFPMLMNVFFLTTHHKSLKTGDAISHP